MVFSVVIPTYNRQTSLTQCLQTLTVQTFDGPWEVIVVDDGGTEALDALIQIFQKPLHITLLRQTNKGPATARNLGVEHAKGKYIAFLDDDCEPHSGWLTELVAKLEPRVMVGGRTENKLIRNPYTETSQRLIHFLYQYFKNTPWYFYTSNNFSLERKAFLEVGGFDESFSTAAGEDREFCARWLKYQNKMVYEPKAIVFHSHNLDGLSFWKMHFKYGKATVDFMGKLTHLGIEKLKPRLSFYFDLILFVMRVDEGNWIYKLRFLFLMLISQFATFCGFVVRTYKRPG